MEARPRDASPEAWERQFAAWRGMTPARKFAQMEGMRASVASSILGEPRSTFDVDIAVATTEPQLGRLADALGPAFYFDAREAARAWRSGASANAVHSCDGSGSAGRPATGNGAMSSAWCASRASGSTARIWMPAPPRWA